MMDSEHMVWMEDVLQDLISSDDFEVQEEHSEESDSSSSSSSSEDATQNA